MIVGYEVGAVSSWSGLLITRAALLVSTQVESHYRGGALRSIGYRPGAAEGLVITLTYEYSFD